MHMIVIVKKPKTHLVICLMEQRKDNNGSSRKKLLNLYSPAMYMHEPYLGRFG